MSRRPVVKRTPCEPLRRGHNYDKILGRAQDVACTTKALSHDMCMCEWPVWICRARCLVFGGLGVRGGVLSAPIFRLRHGLVVDIQAGRDLHLRSPGSFRPPASYTGACLEPRTCIRIVGHIFAALSWVGGEGGGGGEWYVCCWPHVSLFAYLSSFPDSAASRTCTPGALDHQRAPQPCPTTSWACTCPHGGPIVLCMHHIAKQHVDSLDSIDVGKPVHEGPPSLPVGSRLAPHVPRGGGPHHEIESIGDGAADQDRWRVQVVRGPHSMDVLGARWLARSSVPVPQILTFARWASPILVMCIGSARIQNIGSFMGHETSAVEPQVVEGRTRTIQYRSTDLATQQGRHAEARGHVSSPDHQPDQATPSYSRRASGRECMAVEGVWPFGRDGAFDVPHAVQDRVCAWIAHTEIPGGGGCPQALAGTPESVGPCLRARATLDPPSRKAVNVVGSDGQVIAVPVS